MTNTPTPTVTLPLIILLVPVVAATGLLVSGLVKHDRNIEKGKER